MCIRDRDYTILPAFDTFIKILCCQVAVVITDQSDTPVWIDMFEVFQWCAGEGHCFSRLTGAHSQIHSLTAVIKTMGLLTTGTVRRHAMITAGVNYTGRWLTIAVACQVSNISCQLQMRWQLISVSVFVFSISVLLSFWTFSLPFQTFSLPFHFRFYWHFCFRFRFR